MTGGTTKMPVYVVWYSYWDNDRDYILGIYRTRESAQKAHDALADRSIMSKWIDEHTLED